MKDGIIKENGASRLVKGSLPATYDEFKALAASAGVPVDVLFNAAGWQQLPTFLNKENLLRDLTAQLFGLKPADDPTVDDAFLAVFLTSSNAGLVKIQVYEAGTQTPIGGVRIIGVTDMLGGDLYADDQGFALGLATSETSTIKVSTDYLDLTAQTTFTGETPAQKITEVTLYATRVSNQAGKTETFTVSTQKMFTNKVKRVDVHCVGGGAGGSTGSARYKSSDSGDTHTATSGQGGGGGESVFKTDVLFQANTLFQIVVGGKGTGQAGHKNPEDSTSSGRATISSKNGTAGGTSSCLGIIAQGGSINKTTAVTESKSSSSEFSHPEGNPGVSSTIPLFGEPGSPLAGGGDGASGDAAAGRYKTSGSSPGNRALGGDPNGGDSGYSRIPSRISASVYAALDGAQPGGGGGGGAACALSMNGFYFYATSDSGDGGDGAVYVRWFYA